MLYSSVIVAISIVTGGDDAPIAPAPNQHELIERIVATGGDAETVSGVIVNVSLRDVTDRDLAMLQELNAVEYLDCAYCNINGSGLQHIVQMCQLKSLWLHDNQLRDKYLIYVSRFPNLHTLWLENTPTTDEGLRHLRNLKSLERLYLQNTQVTDEGLKHLAGLVKLREVDVSKTSVTREGVEGLRLLLPRARIWGP